MLRYERKYRIEGLPLPWIKQVIIGHPMSFRSHYPDRQVNNIYFDSPDLSAFKENVAGVPERRKHRLRWYGEVATQLPKPVFEIKIKDRELGRKESQVLRSTPWENLPESLANLPAFKEMPLLPVMINAYQRSYFLSSDQRFRITLDWGLRFSPYNASSPPDALFSLPDEAIIMEVKYALEDDDRAQEVFQHLPFRQTKNSKYVTGINLLLG